MKIAIKIAILVEGETEAAFREKFRDFLTSHLGQNMPKLKFIPQHGRIPKEGKAYGRKSFRQ